MNREQVKEMFKFLKDVYPQLEVSSSRVDTWTQLLKDQNPAKVMRNAERYALENKFPPSVADIREPITEASNSDFLQKTKKWREQASGGKFRS